MQQYIFPFNLRVSWFAKRIQHDKQTFEATGVSIRILLESVFEMMASVSIFQLPRAFKLKNQNAIVVRALPSLKAHRCCAQDERVLLSPRKGALQFSKCLHP